MTVAEEESTSFTHATAKVALAPLVGLVHWIDSACGASDGEFETAPEDPSAFPSHCSSDFHDVADVRSLPAAVSENSSIDMDHPQI